MDFSNENVLLQELPTISDVEFNPLEKVYLKVLRISYSISTLIILLIGVALFFFIKRWQLPVAIYITAVAFIALTMLGWIWNTMSFKYSGYALREQDILYQNGWLIRKTKAVPLKRVQHVSVQSGPIERKFRLSAISIFTAGSDEADFTIKGITAETAQQIKEWISTQLNGEPD